MKVVESRQYSKPGKNMKFKPEKTAFGRHESFALRYGWLTKGFQAFEQNQNIFSNPDSIVTLGVG